MNETEMMEHLAQAQRHLALGERAVGRQRALIAQLERDGHDATRAKALLAEFERTLELQRADHARIQAESAGAGRN